MQPDRRRAAPLSRALWGAAILSVGPASTAAAGTLTPDAFFAFCASTTLAEAVAKGTALDWRRIDDAELTSWKDAMESDPGVRAQAAGFRKGDDAESDSLTFEVVDGGPQSYRACSYGTRGQTDIPKALRERYGVPATSEDTDVANAQFWQAGPVQAAASRVGTAVYVRIATEN